jgi:ubiquinone/menaquinone biosynthesis C-methylase UbiE
MVDRNPEWLVGDACGHLPLRSEVADAVVCQYAAGHFADPPAAFREMARVLRRNGVLLLGGREARGRARVGRWLNGTRGLDRGQTAAQLVAAGFREATCGVLDPVETRFRSRFLLFRARR